MPNSLDKVLQQAHRSIAAQVDSDPDRAQLKIREQSFARLIAEEGMSQTDAYTVAFNPNPDAKPESIQQMASRVANRPRVQAEIQRLLNNEKELAMSKESRLGIAFDGAAVNQRIALELFAIIVSTKADSLRVKCMEVLGKMKHVDSFVGAGAVLDDAKKSASLEASNAGEARAKVMDYVKVALAKRISEATVEAYPQKHPDQQE